MTKKTVSCQHIITAKVTEYFNDPTMYWVPKLQQNHIDSLRPLESVLHLMLQCFN